MVISLNEFIRVSIGWIYCLAPYNKPRNIEEIVDEIIKRFKADSNHIGKDFFFHEVKAENVTKFVKDILMPIKKFRELNLSKKEYEAGVEVDDDSRTEFVFVSMFNDITEEDSFIDLDACIRNISSELIRGGEE